MRLDDMTVTPAPERTAYLLVLERMRRIVDGVKRLPSNENGRHEAGVDDGSARDLKAARALEYARLLPRRHQPRERIGQLVKGEEFLRRRSDDASGRESHQKVSHTKARAWIKSPTMSAQIVFISLYLGLIAGRQPVELQAGPSVKSVRVLVDGREAAVLQSPPWRAIVDLGPAFQP